MFRMIEGGGRTYMKGKIGINLSIIVVISLLVLLEFTKIKGWAEIIIIFLCLGISIIILFTLKKRSM